MKKALVLLLTVAMAGTLAACGGSGKDTGESQEAAPAVEAEAPAESEADAPAAEAEAPRKLTLTLLTPSVSASWCSTRLLTRQPRDLRMP